MPAASSARMSVEDKIERISQDLHDIGLNTSKPKVKPSSGSATPKQKSKEKAVAESWEDDASGSDDEHKSHISETSDSVEAPGPTHLKSPSARAADADDELEQVPDQKLPHVPPPTPISPTVSGIRPTWSPARGLDGSRPIPSSYSDYSSPRSTPPTLSANPTPRHGTPELDRDTERRRPEKTTALANRLIAGALGVKPPPKTEEQKRYERATKEQEIKRRNRERELKKQEEEEAEKAKTAMWDS